LRDPISIIIVDDHAIFRKGVLETLGYEAELKVVGEGANREDALELVARLSPAVALIDLSMPGGGIQATRDIHAQYPSVKVIVLTVSEEDDDVMQALEAGASGYVLKGISAEELLTVIHSVATGASYVAPTLGFRLLRGLHTRDEEQKSNDLWRRLTPKEKETLRLIGLGLNNDEIAQRVGVHVKTVKFHVSNLFGKLKLRNRVELALFSQKTSQRPPG
jgi:DNA-binding NarL/FixJ family response regulator